MTGSLETEAQAIPFVNWAEFLSAFNWEQGDHITCIGPTGSGKTTLAREVMRQRDWMLTVATKPRDPIIKELKEDGFITVRNWPDDKVKALIAARRKVRVIFWPKIENMRDVRTQRVEVYNVLRDVYKSGGWGIYFDEIRYITETLRLAQQVDLLLLQGRTLGLSIMGGTQRPSKIPLTCYDQASHLFLWRDNDENNLKRLGGLGGINAKLVRYTVARLPRHEFLYLNTREGHMVRSNVRS